MSSIDNTANPYTGITAQEAYSKTREHFLSSKTKEVAKGWLWAIRIKAEVQAFITKPVVLITASSIVAVASLAIRPVNIGLTLIAFIVCVIGSSVLGQAIWSSVQGSLPQLSNHYAAIAKLAKNEIETANNPFGAKEV